MARGKKSTDDLLRDLRASMEALVAAARKEGRDEALAGLRALVEPGSAGRPARAARGAGKAAKAARPKKARKNPWAGLTPEQRLERVNAIRKGKGLPPKTAL